ncbi:MAG: hypothetical protein ACREJC_06950 [Tepidisphaeraceae bacterium]
MARQAALPTYRTAARVLEGEKGSGIKLAGWTVARTLMIAPPMMIVGVPMKQAFAGAAFASALISVFTVARIFNARQTGMAGLSYGARRPRRGIARRASR